jgi:hypothetical protein
MGYFYFDFRDTDKQSLRSLLSSLLIQLSAHSDTFCDILSRLYLEHENGALMPSDFALTRCLKEMITFPYHGPVYLIMDGLDECPNDDGLPSPRKQVLDLVEDLVRLHRPSLHVCVTSRPEWDIRAFLEPLASHSFSLDDASGQKEYIARSIRSVVSSETRFMRWRDDDKQFVIETLSERSDGM